MHPKFAERVGKLTTPFRVPTDPPRPEVWETFRLPGQPPFTPSGPVLTHLLNLNILKSSQQFWDAELELRLKEYQRRANFRCDK
jgi:hypothetical protein